MINMDGLLKKPVAITKQGKDGLEEIGRIMENLRTHEHKEVGKSWML